jgi:hypothetical protein
MIDERYSGWTSGIGAEILAGKHDLASLEQHVLQKNTEPKKISFLDFFLLSYFVFLIIVILLLFFCAWTELARKPEVESLTFFGTLLFFLSSPSPSSPSPSLKY